MTSEISRDYIHGGERTYPDSRDDFLSDPQRHRIYQEEAAEKTCGCNSQRRCCFRVKSDPGPTPPGVHIAVNIGVRSM